MLSESLQTAFILHIGNVCWRTSMALRAHNPGVNEIANLLPRAGLTAQYSGATPPGATLVLAFDVDDWKNVHWHSGEIEAHITPRMLAG